MEDAEKQELVCRVYVRVVRVVDRHVGGGVTVLRRWEEVEDVHDVGSVKVDGLVESRLVCSGDTS